MAGLVAVAEDLARTGPAARNQEIRIFTRSLAAVRAVSRLKTQWGQKNHQADFTEVKRVKGANNRVVLIWLPAATECIIAQQAKPAARACTEPGRLAAGHLPAANSTMISTRNAKGELDTALP